MNEPIAAKTEPTQRAWVEVDQCAIESNARILKGLLAKNCLLMAVVKADGYGHGAQNVSIAALKGGADALGVATLQEGIDLRQAGLDSPILILGNLINAEEFAACLHWKLMPTLCSLREVLICQKLAEENILPFGVHLKIDTGMTRLGCDVDQAVSLVSVISESKNLLLKGIYSHLALADGPRKGLSEKVTIEQQKRFNEFLLSLPKKYKEVCKHIANSAGTLRSNKLHYDMVRVGLALYGYRPVNQLHDDLGLKPALSVKARVTFIREVSSGIGVSYGHLFTTKKTTRLAVIAIGYADGINRALSGKISVLNNGNYLPQVGAITMDQMVVDASNSKDLKVGSVVTLLGCDSGQRISPMEWSELIGSIPWEILCGFKYRLPRVVI